MEKNECTCLDIMYRVITRLYVLGGRTTGRFQSWQDIDISWTNNTSRLIAAEEKAPTNNCSYEYTVRIFRDGKDGRML